MLCECVGIDDYPGEIQNYFAKCVWLLKWTQSTCCRRGLVFSSYRSMGPYTCTSVRAVTGETRLYGVVKPNHPMNLVCSYVTCIVVHCAVSAGTCWVQSLERRGFSITLVAVNCFLCYLAYIKIFNDLLLSSKP